MIETKQAEELGNGVVDCATETKLVCAACGYDLDAAEIAADTCADWKTSRIREDSGTRRT